MKHNSATLAHRLWARGYEGSWFYFQLAAHRYRYDFSIKHICDLIEDGDYLIDIGTGLGIVPLTVMMNFDNVKIKGIDKEVQSDRIMKFLPEFKERIYFEKLNITELSDTVDVIICMEVLEHNFNDKVMFEKMWMLAKKAIFFSVPSEHYTAQTKGHLRKYTKEDIAKLIKPFTDNFEIFDYEQAEQCHFVVIRK